MTCIFFNLPCALSSPITPAFCGKTEWQISQSPSLSWCRWWGKGTSPLLPPGRLISAAPLFWVASPLVARDPAATISIPIQSSRNILIFIIDFPSGNVAFPAIGKRIQLVAPQVCWFSGCLFQSDPSAWWDAFTFTLNLTLRKVDGFVALGAGMRTIEFIWKDFFDFAAFGAFASKWFKSFKALVTRTMLWGRCCIGHNVLRLILDSLLSYIKKVQLCSLLKRITTKKQHRK